MESRALEKGEGGFAGVSIGLMKFEGANANPFLFRHEPRNDVVSSGKEV